MPSSTRCAEQRFLVRRGMDFKQIPIVAALVKTYTSLGTADSFLRAELFFVFRFHRRRFLLQMFSYIVGKIKSAHLRIENGRSVYLI